MAYRSLPISLHELAEHTSEALALATKEYFTQNPKKTVFKANGKIRIRKHLTKINMFEIHGR